MKSKYFGSVICLLFHLWKKRKQISSSHFSFGARVAVLWDTAALPPLSLAAWQHNGDLSSREVSFVDIDSGRKMHFFPHPLNVMRQRQLPSLCVRAEWVVSYKNSSSVFPQQKEHLCQSQMNVFTKSGPEGDPISTARLQWAANIRHNNARQSAEAAFKKKIIENSGSRFFLKLQARASSETTSKS